MARLLPTLLVLGLLGGTAAAFAITEGLKLEKSPIARTSITGRVFSPECRCDREEARIFFRLRHADTLTLSVVDGDEDVVATLAHQYFREGDVRRSWDGRDEAGLMVPDGSYKLRVHLRRRHQTINLPNTIEVDTMPPGVALTSVRPTVISPNRDGRADYTTIRFHVSGSARPLLYVDGKLTARGRLVPSAGALHWFGKVDGRRYPAGAYRLTLRAQDRAGNVSDPTRAVIVRIRFIEVPRKVVRVSAGQRFAFRVSADTKVVRWLLHGRRGYSAPGKLRLRAPEKPGKYRLYVTAAGHAQTAVVVVSK